MLKLQFIIRVAKFKGYNPIKKWQTFNLKYLPIVPRETVPLILD